LPVGHVQFEHPAARLFQLPETACLPSRRPDGKPRPDQGKRARAADTRRAPRHQDGLRRGRQPPHVIVIHNVNLYHISRRASTRAHTRLKLGEQPGTFLARQENAGCQPCKADAPNQMICLQPSAKPRSLKPAPSRRYGLFRSIGVRFARRDASLLSWRQGWPGGAASHSGDWSSGGAGRGASATVRRGCGAALGKGNRAGDRPSKSGRSAVRPCP